MSGCWKGAALRSCSGYTTHLHLDAGIDGIITEIQSRKFKTWLRSFRLERWILGTPPPRGFYPGGTAARCCANYLDEVAR